MAHDGEGPEEDGRAGRSGDGSGSGSRWGTWGLVAAGVCCFALAASTAFRLPVFFGADETGHFSYTVYLVEGRIPEVGDPVPSADERFPVVAERVGFERVPLRHKRGYVYVANHPPLFYALAAGPVRLAAYSSSETLPPLALRLVNAACMAGGVVLTGRLAGALFRRRSVTPLVAAGLAAVTADVVGVAALGHNDGMGFALTAGALLLMVQLLRRGPAPGLIVAATLVSTACALTRAGLAMAVAGLVLATLIGALRRSPVPLRRAWSWPPAWSWAIVATVPVVSSAWFYLRNDRLYGSYTADDYLLDHLERPDKGTWVDILQRGVFHENMWKGLYGSVHPRLVYPGTAWVLAGLVALAVAGLVAVSVRRLVERGRARAEARHLPEPAGRANGDGHSDSGSGSDVEVTTDDDLAALLADGPKHRVRAEPTGIGIAGWLLLSAYTTGIIVGVADFVSKGGSPHPRYFLPFVPLVSALVAGAIAELPLRRIVGVAAIAGLAAVTASQLMRYDDLIEAKDDAGSLWRSDPAAEPVLQRIAVAVAVVAFVGLVVAIIRSSGGTARSAAPPDEPEPAPRAEERSAVAALDGAA